MTMTLRGTRASRFLAPLAAAGTAGALLLASPAAANAAAVNGVVGGEYAGDGVGYNKVIDGYAAGSTLLKVEGGETIEVFCIQFGKAVSRTNTFTARTWADSGVKNVDKAADIAVRHAAIGTKLTSPQAENAATQLAIWSLTDAVDVTKVPNAAIVARAAELTKNATAAKEGPSSFSLTAKASVTGTGKDAKSSVVASLKTAAGTPIEGQQVTVKVGTVERLASTDATGDAAVTLPATDKETPVTVTFTGTLPAGSVVAPATGQIMVTAQGAKVTRTVSTTMSAAPTAVTPLPQVTTKPTPTKAPVVTPTKAPVKAEVTPAPSEPKGEPVVSEPKQLPYTGGWASAWMLLAPLSALGGGYFLRRKQLAGR